MDQTTKEKIITANITLHSKEAPLYDYIHPELTNKEESGRLTNLIQKALELLPTDCEKKALDIGAGTGFVTEKLLDINFSVDAVDLSKEMLEVLEIKIENFSTMHDAHSTIQNTNFQNKPEIFNIDADNFLQQTDKKYSLITASSVLHHLPDYGQTIGSMAEHLIPGGCIILFHEPTENKFSKLQKFLQRVDWKLKRFSPSFWPILKKLRQANLNHEMADYHVTFGFDEKKVINSLKNANLEIVLLQRYSTAQTWIIRKIFSWFFPPTTWSLLARLNTL